MPPDPETFNTTGAGAEPGINPRRTSASARYGYFKEECIIEVADYSTEYVSIRRMNNEGLLDLLKEPSSSHRLTRKGLSGSIHSSFTRWINIGGIDWDVLSAIALKYDLHSLALEDVIHEQGHNQSKADYYQSHLFIRILCHSLDLDGPATHKVDPPSEFPKRGSTDSAIERGQPLDAEKPALHSPKKSIRRLRMHDSKRHQWTGLTGFHSLARQRQLLRIRALTLGDHIDVRHEPMFIFLTRNGTVISIRPSANIEFMAPITERLHQEDSLLRTSEDASLLVESLLDLAVDRILEVTDKYQDKIYELEQDVLLQPEMNIVRRLHILSGDLIMHKRTLDPVRTMIDGLRKYDVDRFTALVNHPNRSAVGPGERDESLRTTADSLEDGYLSHKAKMYLADVHDHMDYVLTSLDMFAGMSENLINYAFNMASYEMNQVMSRLTFVTIIFLPLTLLTGYFGMNFNDFSAINNHTVILFWEITIPMMAVLIPVFMMSDIIRVVRHVRRMIETRNATELE